MIGFDSAEGCHPFRGHDSFDSTEGEVFGVRRPSEGNCSESDEVAIEPTADLQALAEGVQTAPSSSSCNNANNSSSSSSSSSSKECKGRGSKGRSRGKNERRRNKVNESKFLKPPQIVSSCQPSDTSGVTEGSSNTGRRKRSKSAYPAKPSHSRDKEKLSKHTSPSASKRSSPRPQHEHTHPTSPRMKASRSSRSAKPVEGLSLQGIAPTTPDTDLTAVLHTLEKERALREKAEKELKHQKEKCRKLKEKYALLEAELKAFQAVFDASAPLPHHKDVIKKLKKERTRDKEKDKSKERENPKEEERSKEKDSMSEKKRPSGFSSLLSPRGNQHKKRLSVQGKFGMARFFHLIVVALPRLKTC